MSERRSILCPNCNKLISVDEETCPYCGIKNPGSFLKNNALVRGVFQEDGLLNILILANVIFYAISVLLDPSNLLKPTGLFSIASPTNKSLFVMGMTGVIPIQSGNWWSLVAANYLHGGLLHIIFNMYAIKQLGPMVLKEYGVHRAITIYTLGGIGGFVVSYFGGIYITIGASAAVCAWLGALLFYGWNRGGNYGSTILRMSGQWVLYLAVFGLLLGGVINNWGHGGGLVCGFLIAMSLGYKEKQADTLLQKGLSAISILLTISVLAWSLYSVVRYKFF